MIDEMTVDQLYKKLYKDLKGEFSRNISDIKSEIRILKTGMDKN